MSQESVEVVQRVLTIAQRGVGDPGAVFDEWVREGLVARNVEWRAGGRGGMAVAGLDDVAGREGYLNVARIWTEDFDEIALETEQVLDAGDDRVVAIMRVSGRSKGGQAPVEIRTGMVCTLQSRQIVRIAPFINPDHALNAMELGGF